MATWHQKKIAKTLDLQGFVRCRTTIVNLRLQVRFLSPAPKKTVDLVKKSTVFSTKSVLRRNKSTSWMKSLRRWNRLRRIIDGFNFIWSRRLKISSKLVWISSWVKRTISFFETVNKCIVNHHADFQYQIYATYFVLNVIWFFTILILKY